MPIPSSSARTGAGTSPAISTSAPSLRARQSTPTRLSRRLSDCAPIGRPGELPGNSQGGVGSSAAARSRRSAIRSRRWSASGLRERDRGLTESDRDSLLVDRDVVRGEARDPCDGLREHDNEHAGDTIASLDPVLVQEPTCERDTVVHRDSRRDGGRLRPAGNSSLGISPRSIAQRTKDRATYRSGRGPASHASTSACVEVWRGACLGQRASRAALRRS